jgi:F-type H+-transporting ATPase subunit epsilon
MAEELELEVATPERELVRQQVSEVQVPGKDGALGILPGHAALLGS